MNMKLSALKPHFPKWIHTGYKRVADDPEMMRKAWAQCGLHECFKADFQITARNMFDDGKLFPTQDAWDCVPEGEELEPSAEGDAVDDEGHAVVVPKQNSRGRPAGSKNKFKEIVTAGPQVADATPATTASADATGPSNSDAAPAPAPASTAAAKKKRGRPAGSKNKPKAGQATVPAATRGRGRGRGRGGSTRKLQRISAHSDTNSDSDQPPAQSAWPAMMLLSSDSDGEEL